jgi:DNA-binding transcriptional ArsR family regulator
VATKAERRQATHNRSKAMSHPLRSEALRLMRDRGVISPAEVARALSADVADVSYHMRKLADYECAELVETRPVRGATEHFYRATEQHMLDTEEWADLAASRPDAAEALTDEFMQHIVDDYTASRRRGVVALDEDFHITRTPLILDPEGLKEALASAEQHRLRMTEIAARSAERRQEDAAPEVPVSSSVVLFKSPRFG